MGGRPFFDPEYASTSKESTLKRFYNINENIGEIGSFALPIFIEHLTIASMSIISAMLVSRISPAAIAGVSLVEALNQLIQQVFLSLEIGATVVVAQYCGRKDAKSAGEAVVQAMLTSVAIAMLLSIVMLIFPDFVLHIIFGHAEAAVYASGRTYFTFAVLSFPFLSIYAISIGSIRGSGNPRRSLIGVIVTNVSFILMGLLFVKGFGMGVAGAGLALVLSRLFGATTGIILLKTGNTAMVIQHWIPKKIQWHIQRSILLIGIPACIENLIFLAGRLTTQTYVVPLGTNAMAVNALLNSLVNFYTIPGSTACTMSIPIVGKYLGMKDRQNAIDTSRIILFLSMVVMSVVSVIFFIFIRPIAGLFTTDPAIIAEMAKVARIHFIIAPVFWSLGFVTAAILRSSGDVKYTTTISISSMILFRLTIGYVLGIVFKFGVLGIWVGMYSDWVVRSIFFVIRYMKGKWTERVLIRERATE